MDNPDSPDSMGSDQLTVDLLSPRTKRRSVVINDMNERRDGTPDVGGKNTNNNDVGFVLMDDASPENGTATEGEEEVCILVYRNKFYLNRSL
ncbi:hypothetical protein WA026_003003 [Henosepilachna vigintioctopunctata]|uniref:Uncharacterized protein n=1 Tax=Henosepilachna vigintioctopunctata TaxID=420089 RepID=A0AAW1TLV2_9CUCU